MINLKPIIGIPVAMTTDSGLERADLQKESDVIARTVIVLN